MFLSDLLVDAQTMRMVFEISFLGLGCVSDNNKRPFLVFLKDFACLLRKLIFKNISLVDFQL